MSRGGRGFSSRGSSSYRGSSNRGGSSWGGGRGSYNSRGNPGGGGRFPSFSNNFDSRSKYPSDKYGSRNHDEYRKPYKSEAGGYSGRDHRSPDRKRMRTGSSHERSFGGSRDYNNRYESERRSFSGDGRAGPFARKEEFRKPPLPLPSSPRGGFRGRVSSRGMVRGRTRERPVRRRLVESSYAVRRRVITGRSSDYARRLKISKLRSSIIRRSKKEEPSSDKESDNEETDKKVEPKLDSKENEEKDEEDPEKKVSPKKSPKKEEAATSDKEEDKESEGEDKVKNFIKLTCPHCSTRCVTFGKYTLHLQSGRHAAAMRRVAMKQKSILSQMRLVQRKAQRELEKTTDDLAPRTSWCPLCKLNYKQPKMTHQASQSHKDMKKFLMPYCKICKLTFKSPMIYESHCCNIEHLKRKSLLSSTDDASDKEEGSGNEEDLENFMTIDSVGDMDEEGEIVEKKDGEAKTKEQISVGIENIKKVEVFYCDLCRMYLPRVTEEDEMNRIISRHCKQRTHLQKYIRYKEDKELALRAERLQRKETAEKEKEKVVEPKDGGEKKEESNKEAKAKADGNTTADEEKIWADVDKDLGDILAEAGSGNKSSDEDEEDSVVNGERYDRFKYSEKIGEEMIKDAIKEDKEEEDDKKMEEDTEEAEK